PKPFLRKKRFYQKNFTYSLDWQGIANTEVLFVGVMFVLLAAMLRTAYEGVGWRWVTRSMQQLRDEHLSPSLR
ncbi:MAG: hypothetical protein ACP5E9_09560, partial [Candidatus Methanospirareceae archaeon]